MPPCPHRPSKPTSGLAHGEIERLEGGPTVRISLPPAESRMRIRLVDGRPPHFTRRRSPLRLGPAGYDRQAQFKFTRRRSTICHYGRPRPPSFGLSGPFVSSHRTRVRKASQRFVSLKAFNTEETNQRFRQRSAKVPSSNQWIITQPTPCLLRLRASKGVLSRENVNSSAVSGNTMRGAARISGARARVSCRPRLRAHPRLRYRRSQPCAMRSPFPANARQRAVLRRALP
jgi:hypothetical protein